MSTVRPETVDDPANPWGAVPLFGGDDMLPGAITQLLQLQIVAIQPNHMTPNAIWDDPNSDQ
jgi:hypothetical protein